VKCLEEAAVITVEQSKIRAAIVDEWSLQLMNINFLNSILGYEESGGMTVTKVSRNVTLREAEKYPETPEIMTDPLLQILQKMEARTRKALELARELEELVRSDGAIVGDAIKTTQESTGQPVQSRKYPASRPCKSKEVNMGETEKDAVPRNSY